MLSAALATKLFAAPLLIGLASLAGKRWGPAVAGMLGGLPLVGAPVVIALWLGDGRAAAHAAIDSAPIGVWATMSYLLVYGFISRRLQWPLALACSWVCYLAIASLLHYSGLDQLHWMGLLVLPALLLAAALVLPKPQAISPPVHLPHSELLARMLAAAALVLLLTALASRIGPDFTGVLAGAPVAASVIPSFTLALAGRDALLRTLRGFLTGQMGFAVFFLVLAPALALGPVAWLLATLVGIATSLLAARLLERLGLKHPQPRVNALAVEREL